MDYHNLITTVVDVSEVCGSNLEDDSSFQNFFFESEGTPERFDGQSTVPAEPPEWRTVKKQALSYMEKTRDLKLISILAQSVLNTEGIVKFEQCLNGLAQLVDEYWNEVFPSLDEDDGDPLERISALGHLSDNTFVINVLKNAPIVQSKVFGKVTLRIIERATDSSASKSAGDLDISQINAVFKESDDEEITSMFSAIGQSIVHLQNLNNTFIAKAGNDYSVNFDNTIKTLTHLAASIEKYGNVKIVETIEPQDDEPTSSTISTGENKVTSNTQNSQNGLSFQDGNFKLSSREDVEHCFDLICAYYTEYEPSSPIPVLINRSKKLVHMDFMDIVKEIMPDALDQITKLGGIVEDDNQQQSTANNKSDDSW